MKSGYCEGLKRDQVVKIASLTGCKNFVGRPKRENCVIFNAFVDLKPVQRFENGSDMCEFRSLDNSMSYPPPHTIILVLLKLSNRIAMNQVVYGRNTATESKYSESLPVNCRRLLSKVQSRVPNAYVPIYLVLNQRLVMFSFVQLMAYVAYVR